MTETARAADMQDAMAELRRRLGEVNDLESAAALLHWDQSTYMPAEGAAARGRQLATLTRLAHERFTDAAMGELLEKLRPYEESLEYGGDEASLIRVARRHYERATRLPTAFVAQAAAHQSETYDVWTKARPANDFSMVQGHLAKTLELSRRYSEYFPNREHVADPLIDMADYGLKTETVLRVFAQLREELAPLAEAICRQKPAQDGCLHESYPAEAQLAFGKEVVRRLGYDFSRGRVDLTHHPFMTKFSLGDVRITTRVKENDLSEAIFSTIHEAGHALYEQGISRELEGGPLADGTGAGVHESQSRLWENVVGRSRGFWQYFYPKLQAAFPARLRRTGLEEFHRAINKVSRSLIRTDADEVTYNLHVMIRFELELELLEGRLSVADLPEAWRRKYREYLGIEVPDDRDGVLQDVHWYMHYIGGCFQGYTLGNLMGAQFYEAAVGARPEIPDEIVQGRFEALREWLTENVYRHGAKFTTMELLERVTGKGLEVGPYMRYLRTKYGALYDLP